MIGGFLRRTFWAVISRLKFVIGVIRTGFHVNGIEGGLNSIASLMLPRPRREDGIQLLSHLRLDGVTFIRISWFNEDSLIRMLRSLEDFPVRDDDVFVVSYQKCGHHFIYEILRMLLSGKTELYKGIKEEDHLEFYPQPSTHFSKKPSPRLIMTHLPYKFMPKRILDSGCRIIRLSRNPKDVFVSYYHHYLAIKSHDYEDTFENFMRLHLESPCHAVNGCYFRFELDYLRGLKDRPNTLRLSFEGLKKNTSETIGGIGRFLRLECTDEFYEEVTKASSFDNVKAAKDPSQIRAQETFYKKGRSLYRRGVVGDWRHHFTVAINEAVDAKIHAEWGGTELETMFHYGDEATANP